MSHPAILTGFFFVCLLWSQTSFAWVEIGLLGVEPTVIEEVYQRQGTSFVAIDDVLGSVALTGEWDSVDHVYRIRTPRGTGIISPGSQFLKFGERLTPIPHRPRFIDGKLRVSETFIQQQLAPLLDTPLYYVNHDPPEVTASGDPLDRLFSFLLRKKPQVVDHGKRIVVIDPGHGGQDLGALGRNGEKEKLLTFQISQRLEKLLKMHQDAPVVMTRDDDYAVEAQHRLEIAAEASADLLLSLHVQSFFRQEPHGIMLYIQPEIEQEIIAGMLTENSSLPLAVSLRQALADAGFMVHEIQQQPVFPLGRGDLPRVLIEMGNLNHSGDLAILQDQTRQQDLARALFEGVQSYFRSQQEKIREELPPQPQS